ncbi:MAG TPA: hypothetical protein VM580_19375, partial [Labilithrix sp.]|nr:hypothetical protein [Labilithrix sp.]
MSQSSRAEDEGNSVAPPPASIPPLRTLKSVRPPAQVSPSKPPESTVPARAPTAEAKPARRVPTSLLVVAVLVLGAVDSVIPLRRWSSFSLSALLT